MMYKSKVAVCSEIRTKHSMQSEHHVKYLTLFLLTWRIWWAPNKASKWQMGFNLVFKGLMLNLVNLTFRGPCIMIYSRWFYYKNNLKLVVSKETARL